MRSRKVSLRAKPGSPSGKTHHPPTIAMTIYNLIILDASGSMQSIREATISGFNELIQGIRAEGEKDPELTQYIQFFSFNSMGIKELIPLRPATDLPQLNEENYRP